MMKRNNIIFILPALSFLLLFIAIPALYTIVISFQELSFGESGTYVGFKNYLILFRDEYARRDLGYTLLFCLLVVPGQVLVGLLAAVVLSTKFRLQKLWVSIFMIPYAVSEVVAVVIWKYMLEPDVGVINNIICFLFQLEKFNWGANTIQAWMVLVSLKIWLDFPFSFLIIYSAIIIIPIELYEAAFIDGAGNIMTLRKIVLPMISSSVMVAAIFGFVFSFRNFGTVWLLTKGGPVRQTELLPILLYKQAFSYWEFGLASATAIVMTIITFAISAPYIKRMFHHMYQ